MIDMENPCCEVGKEMEIYAHWYFLVMFMTPEAQEDLINQINK